MESKKFYNHAIAMLRVVAIFAVIAIHTTTRILEATGYNIEKFPFTLFFNQSLRFAVPLFFLISGFVLELNYREKMHYPTYIKKRASRIILPYLCWSIFYYVFVYHYPLDAKTFLSALLNGDASYQLYFIPTLILFYILFPFFHHLYPLFVKKPFFICLLILELLLLTQDYYFAPIHLAIPIRIALLNFEIFFLGMVASHHEEKILAFVKKWLVLFLLLLLFSPFILYQESRHNFLATRNIDAIYSQWHPSVFLYTLLVCSILFFVFTKVVRVNRALQTVSKLSFFVFFVHVAILYLFWYGVGEGMLKKIGAKQPQETLYELLFFAFVTITSFALGFLFHKIPKLRMLTG